MDRYGSTHPERHASQAHRHAASPGRIEEQRSSARRSRVSEQQPALHVPATELLRELLGPMRWLGPSRGSDLSEAFGGMPGDAGWLLELPDDGGVVSITVSRRLGSMDDETRVVLFQEVRGYAGLTWCIAADTPDGLERVRAEVTGMLSQGARVVSGSRQ